MLGRPAAMATFYGRGTTLHATDVTLADVNYGMSQSLDRQSSKHLQNHGLCIVAFDLLTGLRSMLAGGVDQGWLQA